MHMTLTKNAKRFRFWGDVFYYLSLLFSLVAAAASIVAGLPVITGDAGAKEFMFHLLICVPLLSSALGAYISKTRFLQKWGVTHTAAGQIVAEIYKFRCHILEYNPISGQKTAEEEEEEGGGI
jgi:hypothetical protein